MLRQDKTPSCTFFSISGSPVHGVTRKSYLLVLRPTAYRRYQPVQHRVRQRISALHSINSAAVVHHPPILSSRCIAGNKNRRAILLAQFRVIRTAYDSLEAVLLASGDHRAGIEKVHQHGPVASIAPSYCKHATLLPEEEEPKRNGIPSSPDDAEGNATYAAAADNVEPFRWSSRGAVKSARRESRIVLWALRDAAARVVQEETRSYARRRQWLSGFGQWQGTATTDETKEAFHESSTRDDEDIFNGGYPAVEGGLPWGLATRLSTAVTTATTTTFASSTRGTTARTATATTTTTASSARRRIQAGRSGQSTASVSNRSPLTVESAVYSSWRFPPNPDIDIDYPDGRNATPELEWGSEATWGSGQPHTQLEQVVRRGFDGLAVRWSLLPSEESKKR